MRTLIVRKTGPRQWSATIPGHAVITNVPTSAKALFLGEAMSMLDNPLIGEYTKGISRGTRYFVDLERRIRAEKVPAMPIAEDLKSDLFKAVKGILNANGQDHFGVTFGRKSGRNPVTESCQPSNEKAPKKGQKAAKSGWKRVQLDNLSAVFSGSSAG